jgi:hypothetical protein
MLQLLSLKILCIYNNKTLLVLDDPGRVRSQMANVVCQTLNLVQRFDFDCISVESGGDAKSNNMNTPAFTFKTLCTTRTLRGTGTVQ